MVQQFNPLDYPPFIGFPKEGLKFLASLKKNNNKEWFDAHKSDYENYIKQPMHEFIASMALEFKSWAPEVVANPKRSMFRIYRDIRFSKDKTPYKTHAAAWFPYGSDSELSGGFYVHISPTECILGGGIWMPPNDYLRHMREKIANDHKRFISILKNKAFVKECGKLDEEEMLKTMPRGFDPEHPAAHYLKLKSYTAGKSLPVEKALKKDFLKTAVTTYKAMLPLIKFLSE
jgi:uncharacterized protein (TIGR02453 family)